MAKALQKRLIFRTSSNEGALCCQQRCYAKEAQCRCRLCDNMLFARIPVASYSLAQGGRADRSPPRDPSNLVGGTAGQLYGRQVRHQKPVAFKVLRRRCKPPTPSRRVRCSALCKSLSCENTGGRRSQSLVPPQRYSSATPLVPSQLATAGQSSCLPFSFSRASTSTKVPNAILPNSRKPSKPLQLH